MNGPSGRYFHVFSAAIPSAAIEITEWSTNRSHTPSSQSGRSGRGENLEIGAVLEGCGSSDASVGNVSIEFLVQAFILKTTTRSNGSSADL